MRTKGNGKLTKFDGSKIASISSVRCHRENSIKVELEKGEYVISCSVFKEGEEGDFALEVYLPDELKIASDDLPAHKKLANTVFERIDGTDVKCDLIKSFLSYRDEVRFYRTIKPK